MSNQTTALTIAEIQTLSTTFARSAMFPDIKSEQQAMVKIIAGNELGLPPFASMSGLHVISGKVVMGGNLIATLIKNDPRYDYKIASHDNNHCHIDFYENGERVGESVFTMDDARKVKVWKKDGNGKSILVPLTESNQNWQSYPKNMLFNRAISNGAKWFCAGVFGGSPVYTPEELGQDTDDSGNMIIDVTPIENKPQQPRRQSQPRQNRQSPPRPQSLPSPEPEPTTEPIEGEVVTDFKPMNEGQRAAIHGHGNRVFGDRWDDARAAYVKYLGLESSNDFSFEQAKAFASFMSKVREYSQDEIDEFISVHSE